MRQLTNREVEGVSGGFWQVVLVVYAALEVADALYTAAKSGAASYEENRVSQNNLGQL
jgi:hypothetical protein